MVSLLPEETKPFQDILQTFSSRRILVIGDLMLDRFSYGAVGRISPEAPAAVIHLDEVEEIIGGAGNVARNIASLGGRCDLVAGIGQDEAANIINRLLAALPNISPCLIHMHGRPTTIKTRFVARLHNTHLLRADVENAKAIESALEDQVIDRAKSLIPHNDAILLSDYGKGLLTPRVIEEIIACARKLGKVIVVDPKGSQYDRYRHANFITPNLAELRQAVNSDVSDNHSQVRAASALSTELGCDGILLTRGEMGVLLVSNSGKYHQYPTTAKRVIDVSGAGDTLVSAFLLSIVSGASVENCARLANVAAGIAVGKPGTATVDHDELRSALLSRPTFELSSKIFLSASPLEEIVTKWRSDGLVVGFTNGCFDIIHEGHIELLAEARSYCDRLIVGLNSDASVKRLKGASRPIQSEKVRAKVMAAFSFVDAVVCFDEDTPLQLVSKILPNVLVKGADYAPDQVIGREIVEEHGGRVVLVSLLANSSTTGIVQRLRSQDGRLSDMSIA